MAQIAPIVLADGQTTPVNKTFDVFTAQSGDKPAVWYEKSAGSFAGYKRVSMLVGRSASNKTTKVTIMIHLPTLAVTAPSTGTGIQPSPTVAYSLLSKQEFYLHDDCVLQERKDMRAFAKNLLNNSIVIEAIEQLSPAY